MTMRLGARSRRLARARFFGQIFQSQSAGRVPLRLADPIELATHVASCAIVARFEFEPAPDSQSLKDTVSGNLVERLRRREANFPIQHFDEQLGLEEGPDDLADQTRGYAQRFGQSIDSGGPFAALKTLGDVRHDAQGDELAPPLVDAFGLFFLRSEEHTSVLLSRFRN